MDEKLDRILEELKDIKEKVDDLWRFNNMSTYKEFPPIVNSRSPISLNDLGESILKEYKGDKNVDLILDTLLSEIEKRNFKSPLDVQDFSEKIVLSKFNSDSFTEIKNLIYHNPIYKEHSININIMSLLMGLYLRDKYLGTHPELLEPLTS